MPERAMLMRVGIDGTKGTGNWYSPYFDDMSFVLLPIIEGWAFGVPTYGEYLNELGVESMDCFSKRKYSEMEDKQIHLDPNFENFTYGEPGSKKMKNLRKLSKGDLLVFMGAFWPFRRGATRKELEPQKKMGIFGYFELARNPCTIRSLIPDDDFDKLNEDIENIRTLLPDESYADNPHVQRILDGYDENLDTLLICGSENSALLSKVKLIAEIDGTTYRTLPDFVNVLGKERISPLSFIPYYFEGENLERLMEFLEIK